MWHSREAARYPCAASSSPSSRRSVFHWTHVVGIPLVIFLFVLHTPQNGGWTLLVPTVILGLEMAFRAAAACAPPLRITALVPLPGNACEVRHGVYSLPSSKYISSSLTSSKYVPQLCAAAAGAPGAAALVDLPPGPVRVAAHPGRRSHGPRGGCVSGELPLTVERIQPGCTGTHPCPTPALAPTPALPLPAATLYHPFAMSSPAEASNMLTFHVKATGGGGDAQEGWTAALNRLARERAELDRTLTRGQSAVTAPSAVAAERLQSAVTAASHAASLASPRTHDVHETSSRSPAADALSPRSPRMRGQSAFPPQALAAHRTRSVHLAQLVSHWQSVRTARGQSAATGMTRGQTLGTVREGGDGGDAEEAGRAGGSEAPPLPSLPGLLAWVEGPYAAPCQGVLYADHAVLVAAGVGVTPMASILGSMMARARAAKAAAEAIGDPTAGSAASALTPLRRLDIVWVAGESELCPGRRCQ